MVPPCSATHFSALVAVRLYTRTSCPGRCRWPAIGYPITPSPRNASFVILVPLAIVLSRISDYPGAGCKHKRGVARAGMTGLFKWLLRWPSDGHRFAWWPASPSTSCCRGRCPIMTSGCRSRGWMRRSRSCATTPTCRISSAQRSDAAVFFGLGYAHAQDRLWQMTMLRRTAQGRLSEVFGPRTARSTSSCGGSTSTGWRGPRRGAGHLHARRSRPTPPASMPALRDQRGALGRGAPEMFLFNAPIAPWQPADSHRHHQADGGAIVAHRHEVRRARVSLALDDPSRLADILPDAPGSGIAPCRIMPAFPGAAAARVATACRGTARIMARRSAVALPPRAGRGIERLGRGARGRPRARFWPTIRIWVSPRPPIWYLARLELDTAA